MERSDLIGNIAGMEWKMFGLMECKNDQVESPEDYITFMIMRTAQFMAWNSETLESYFDDLNVAYDSGKNLMADKYGYLLQWTRPEAYEKLKASLTPVPQEKLALIDQIMDIQQKQAAAFGQQYPNLGSRGGRPATAAGAWPVSTQESYARSELQIYSVRTLEQYLSYLLLLAENGISFVERVMLYTVSVYGYATLEDAEAAG